MKKNNEARIFWGGLTTLFIMCSLYVIIIENKKSISVYQVAASDQNSNKASLDLQVMEQMKESESRLIKDRRQPLPSIMKAPSQLFVDDTARNVKSSPKVNSRNETDYDGALVVVDELYDLNSRKLQQIIGESISVHKEVSQGKIFLVRDRQPDRASRDFYDVLIKVPEIIFVEKNFKASPDYTPSDVDYPGQHHLHIEDSVLANGNVSGDPDINAREAWDIEREDGKEVIIAILDSGVDYNHPDLRGNMWDGSSSCKDQNGQEITGGCPFHGWDFQDNDNQPYDSWELRQGENGGHGTRVAGVIGAQTDNNHAKSGQNFAGISRYNKVKIMALRTGYNMSNELAAIEFAKQNGADVISLSSSVSGLSVIYQNAVEDFQKIFVTSASNSNRDNDITPRYPCNMDAENIICIAGSNPVTGDLRFPSNYGLQSVDLAAPSAVFTTVASQDENQFTYSTGTSFAAPIVAGVAAMAISNNPGLYPSEVKQIVMDTVRKKTSLRDKVKTGGIVNLESVTRAAQALPIRPTPDPDPEPEGECIDEGNGDSWGINTLTFRGCWISGIPDPALCLDDGDGDDQGLNPGSGVACTLEDDTPEPNQFVLLDDPEFTVEGNKIAIKARFSESARASIDYGLSTNYSDQFNLPSFSISFGHTLTLQPNTTYNIRIRAVSNSGDEFTSKNYQITTRYEQEPPLGSLSLTADPIFTVSGKSVQINFTFNKPAKAWFEYGVTTNYTNQSELSTTYDFASHQHTLSLQPSTTYNVLFRASTSSGETYTSNNYQFTTGDVQEPPNNPSSCIDEGNGDNWGFDPATNSGCWINGIPDPNLCLDDGDGNEQGLHPETGETCQLGDANHKVITINARGTNGQEKIALFINGEPQKFWDLSKQFQNYTFTPLEVTTINSLSVAFLNDRWEPENSINYDVQVDYIIVKGIKYQSEDVSTQSTGTWDQENWCAPGSKSNEWLHCTGQFTYDIPVGTEVRP